MDKLRGGLSWLFIQSLFLGSILLTAVVLRGALSPRLAAGGWSWMCRLTALAYGGWFWYDRKRPFDGSVSRRPWIVWLMLPVLRGARAYIDASVIVDDGPLQDREAGSLPVMFCCHPHGIWSLGVLSNFCFSGTGDTREQVVICTLDAHFYVPLWREICLGMGFASVSRHSLENLLRRDKSVTVVLGGAREALDSRPGTMELTLRRRKGFFRTALQWGVPIRAVLTWGEVELYQTIQWPWLRRLQNVALRFMSFSLPCFWGRYGWIPAPQTVTSVIGKPVFLDVDHAAGQRRLHPTEREITNLREKYIVSLQALHSKYNQQLGPTHLIIR